jgi:hypothetical protein
VALSVALFSWEYPFLGSAVTDLGYLVGIMASGLRSMGWDVYVVVPSDRDSDDELFGINLLRIGLDVRDHPSVVAYGLSLPSQVMRKLPYLIRRKIGVIHGFEWGGCLMAYSFKVLLGDGSKMFCSVLSTEYQRGDPRSSSLSASIASIEEYVFSKSDLLLVHSKQAYESLLSNYTVKQPLLATPDLPLDRVLEVYVK